MSLHSSLKVGGSMAKKRNVLNRTERIEKLTATKGFDAQKKSVLNLPKTNTRAAGGAH